MAFWEDYEVKEPMKKHYKLKIVWLERTPQRDGPHIMEEHDHVFPCHVEEFEDELVLVLPNLAHALTNNLFEDGAVVVKTTEWIGGEPPHELKSTEEPAKDKSKIDEEVDIAMALLKDTEPERTKLTIKEICGPLEGPIKVIGEADYDADVPLLGQNMWGDVR